MAKKKKRSRIWIILLLVAVLGALLALVITKAKKSPKGTKVTVEEVKKRTIKETVTGSGRIFPEMEVKISSDVSGEIVKLYVSEGDSVVAGQVLAKINPDAYASAVERGLASVNSAKANASVSKSNIKNYEAQKDQIYANYENAKKTHERNSSLLKNGVISQTEFDQSYAALRSVEANLKAMEASIVSAEENANSAKFNISSAIASLKEMRTNLDRTTIKAPATGVISSLSVEQGERVVGTIQMAGTEMMRIANLNAMEVQIEISENDILKVNLGDETDIEVDAYLDRKFKGTVTEIANSAANISTGSGMSLSSDQVTNFIVKVRIDAKSYKHLITKSSYPFRPGMSASVDIFTNKVDDVLTIPIQAVTTRLEDDAPDDQEPEEVVFVKDADTVRLVKITTGIQDDEFIYVSSGLVADEEIVTGPYSAISKKLEDGDPVLIKKEDEEEDKK